MLWQVLCMDAKCAFDGWVRARQKWDNDLEVARGPEETWEGVEMSRV